MLRKVIIRGFQRHKKLVLEPSSTVTCIVGPSDAGKSSLLRAIRLVCLNRPQGLGYIHKDASMASVTLKFGKHSVNRRRGHDTNLYELDGEIFRAFGNDVPQAIRDLLRVDDASFQMQADSHFWFGDSGGNVSKSLNEVVNLESIDRALAYTKDRVQKTRMEEFLCKEQVESFREQRNKLLWVVRFEKDLSDLESEEEGLTQKRSRLARMRRSLTEARQHKATLDSVSGATLQGEKVLDLGMQAIATQTTRGYLQNLIQKARKAEKLSKVEVPDISEVLARRKEGDDIAERRRYLEMMLVKIRAAKKNLDKYTKELLAMEEEYTQEMKKERKCPSCGQPLPKSPSASPRPTCTSGRPHQ